MKEDAVVKINKFGKAGMIVSRIMEVLMVIASVFLIIGIVSVAVLPKDLVTFRMNGNAEIAVNVGSLGFSLDSQQKADIRENVTSGDLTVGDDNYKMNEVVFENDSFIMTGEGAIKTTYLKDFLLPMIIGLVSTMICCVSLYFARKMFSALRVCRSPFETDVIESLKRFGYSLIPWIIFPSFADSVFKSVFSMNPTYSVGINLKNLFFVLVILALVNIFKYGAILQQESDETL